MSDNNQDKPDDFEVMFETVPDDVPADDAQHDDMRAKDDESEMADFVDADVEFEDINDGDENAFDDDSEDGIFAPDPVKEKKSSGLLSAVALLAVVGAGGYVYYSNPQMIDQVKQNIMGTEVSEAEMPAVETPVSEAPVPESVPETPSVDTPVVQDVPPSTLDEVAEETQKMDVQESMPAVTAVADTPAEDMTPPPSLDAVEVEQPAVVVAEAKVEEKVEEKSEAPKEEALKEDVAVASPPVAEEAKEDIKAEVKSEVKSEAPVEAKADVSAVAPAPEVAVAEAAPPAEQLFTEKKAPKPEAVVADKPVVVASKEEKKLDADAKLDKYFDSPGGKMLKEIPAPSMDVKKGKNESIIIVSKSPQKTSSRKKYNHADSVSIQTNNQMDSKVISANRALMLERYDAAQDMYDELYRLNPRDGRVLMGRAVLFQKMGNTEQAISSYEEVLKYNPDNAEAIVNLAGLIRKQYPAVALNKLLDLRQQYPNNPVVIAQLGVAYADSGNYPDAFHYLSMAASLEPNNPQHFYNMAVVAEKAGDTAKAIQNYEKALEVDAVSGGGGKVISRERIYDRLTRLRGN